MEKRIPGVGFKSEEVWKAEAAEYMKRAAKRSRHQEERYGIRYSPTAQGTHHVDNLGSFQDQVVSSKPTKRSLTQTMLDLINMMEEPTPPDEAQKLAELGYYPELQKSSGYVFWFRDHSS